MNRIFIGSSTEGKLVAEALMELIVELEPDTSRISGWWSDGVFPPGRTFIESLHAAIDTHDAAVFVATEDDKIAKRGQTKFAARDNIIFELGLFSSRLGRTRSVLAVLGNPGLPTDLLGVNTLPLIRSSPINEDLDVSDFKNRNRQNVRSWLQGMEPSHSKTTITDSFPLLSKALLEIQNEVLHDCPELSQQSLDKVASALVHAGTAAFTSDYGIDDVLITTQRRELEDQDTFSICAIDVLGPVGWVSPLSYRYLAPQIRFYHRRNTTEGNWGLIVSKELRNAIDRAISNATNSKKFTAAALPESETEFDNPTDFKVETGFPNLEFSRILLWDEGELLSNVGGAIIAIHEAFNVPLFYLERQRNSDARDVDYIFFKKKDSFAGQFGIKSTRYKTELIKRRSIPFIGNPIIHYNTLLEDPNLLLAVDAREIISRRNHHLSISQDRATNE